VNFYIPFVDHILSHLRTRFPAELKNALLGSYLIPANLDKLTDEQESHIYDEFLQDLPSPDSFEQEVSQRVVTGAELSETIQ